MRFSQSTQAFYPEDITYPALPADVVTVTHAEWQAAIAREPHDTLSIVSGALVVTAGTAPALTNNQVVLSKIAAMESSVTQRRIREAILGIDGGWLKNIDAQIAIERKSL